jgi:hypothetical protein
MKLPGFTADKVVEQPEEPAPGTAPKARYRIGVPGLSSGEVGLGDAISRAASALGIAPCGGCGRRAQALNGWVSFSQRRGALGR